MFVSLSNARDRWLKLRLDTRRVNLSASFCLVVSTDDNIIHGCVGVVSRVYMHDAM
jgi:hypothetical protein